MFCTQVPAEIRRKVRRFIPPKDVLPARIETVVREFRQLRDPRNGKPLITAATEAAVTEVLLHAGRGCLSDYAPVEVCACTPLVV